MMTLALTILDFGLILVTLYAAYESSVEKEQRAVSIFLLTTVFHIAMMYLILYLPGLQMIPLAYFGVLFLLTLKRIVYIFELL